MCKSLPVRSFLLTLLVGWSLGMEGIPRARAQERVSGETRTIQPADVVQWHRLEAFEAARPASLKAPKRFKPEMPSPPPRVIDLPDGRTSPLEGRAPTPPPPPNPRASSITASFQALDDNNAAIPPDTMGAVGLNHVMTMINTEVRIQSKAGATASTVSLDAFWTSGALSGNPFDPRVLFDHRSNRWFACVAVNPVSTTSKLFFGVSDTSDPTAGWTLYEIDVPGTSNWIDYPAMGVNKKWIAITGNMFTVSGNFFAGAAMWVIDRSSALSGGPLTVTVFPAGFDVSSGIDGFTLQPAQTLGKSGKLYLVDNSGWSSGGIPLMRLSQITGRRSSPSWSVVPGSGVVAGSGLYFVDNDFNFSQPDAEQQGTSVDVATNDFRVPSMAVFNNGRLWTAHTAGLPQSGTPDRTAVFWYELDPIQLKKSADPIVQSGVIDGGSGVYHYFPAVAVNDFNEAGVGFSRSDSTRFVEFVATGRRASDSLGTMDAVTVVKAGEDSYVKTFGSGEVRWGDYSAVNVDPSDDESFWLLQEYAESDVGAAASNDRWGTWWAKRLHDALFFDGFANGVLDANWKYRHGNWTESGGSLNGDPELLPNGRLKAKAKTAAAFPAGCSRCTVQASMEVSQPQAEAGGKRNIRVFGWTGSGKMVAAILKPENDRVVLLQKNGKTKFRKSERTVINYNVPYDVKLMFDGMRFRILLDGKELIKMVSRIGAPSGKVGVQSQNSDIELHKIKVK